MSPRGCFSEFIHNPNPHTLRRGRENSLAKRFATREHLLMDNIKKSFQSCSIDSASKEISQAFFKGRGSFLSFRAGNHYEMFTAAYSFETPRCTETPILRQTDSLKTGGTYNLEITTNSPRRFNSKDIAGKQRAFLSNVFFFEETKRACDLWCEQVSKTRMILNGLLCFSSSFVQTAVIRVNGFHIAS